ncbi:MAG: deoxyribose-phosphate aldolase [Treponema sp.]|jgi:deoxyribose-phosphate aldolase|nr:deoxyribose-phosphate aldolase [Treponema sp.]
MVNVNDIVKETHRELEKLLGGRAPAANALSGGGFSRNAQAAPLGPAIVPAGSAAVPAGSAARPAAPAAERAPVLGRGVYSAVPGRLEHSLLDPGITREKVIGECELALQYGIGVVVVSPYFVESAATVLGRTGTAVCSVAGFPHGAASQTAKSAELRECIRRGAVEMDVALNILAIKSGEPGVCRRELQEMLQIARGRCRIKAIYEQSLYNDEEKKTVLSLIRECACDFVKISNALTGKKAEEADLRFVREMVGPKVGIKIDGGVKTLARTLELFGAGADRIGMSATIAVAGEALGS